MVRALRRHGSAHETALRPIQCNRRRLRARRGGGGGRAHRAVRRERGTLLHLPQGRRCPAGQARGRRRQGAREQDPAALRRRIRPAAGCERRRRARRIEQRGCRRTRRPRREAPDAHHAGPGGTLHEGRQGRTEVRVQPQGRRGSERHRARLLNLRHPHRRGRATGT